MRPALLVAAFAALSGAPAFAQQLPDGAPAPARTQAIVVGSIAGALDLALVTADLALVGRDRKPTWLHGVIELTLMVSQLALGISITAYGASRSDDLLIPVGALMSALAIPLLIHGYRAMAHATPAGATTLLIVPSPVGAASRASVGLTAVGTF